MTRFNIKKGRISASISIWLLIISLGITEILFTAQAQEVVVNPSVVQQELSRNSVRAIFGMRLRNWPDGTPVRVFVLNDAHPLHNAFSKKILNIFPHQLRLAWDRLVFSGTGQAPFQVNSEEEMRSLVAATPGAIGYLSETMVNGSVNVPIIQ